MGDKPYELLVDASAPLVRNEKLYRSLASALFDFIPGDRVEVDHVAVSRVGEPAAMHKREMEDEASESQLAENKQRSQPRFTRDMPRKGTLGYPADGSESWTPDTQFQFESIPEREYLTRSKLGMSSQPIIGLTQSSFGSILEGSFNFKVPERQAVRNYIMPSSKDETTLTRVTLDETTRVSEAVSIEDSSGQSPQLSVPRSEISDSQSQFYQPIPALANSHSVMQSFLANFESSTPSSISGSRSQRTTQSSTPGRGHRQLSPSSADFPSTSSTGQGSSFLDTQGYVAQFGQMPPSSTNGYAGNAPSNLTLDGLLANGKKVLQPVDHTTTSTNGAFSASHHAPKTRASSQPKQDATILNTPTINPAPTYHDEVTSPTFTAARRQVQLPEASSHSSAYSSQASSHLPTNRRERTLLSKCFRESPPPARKRAAEGPATPGGVSMPGEPARKRIAHTKAATTDSPRPSEPAKRSVSKVIQQVPRTPAAESAKVVQQVPFTGSSNAAEIQVPVTGPRKGSFDDDVTRIADTPTHIPSQKIEKPSQRPIKTSKLAQVVASDIDVTRVLDSFSEAVPKPVTRAPVSNTKKRMPEKPDITRVLDFFTSPSASPAAAPPSIPESSALSARSSSAFPQPPLSSAFPTPSSAVPPHTQGPTATKSPLWEIRPPPPPTGTGPIPTFITPFLIRIAEQLNLSRYRPASTARPLRPQERGYWHLNLPDKIGGWDHNLLEQTWEYLEKTIGAGKAGWGVSCYKALWNGRENSFDKDSKEVDWQGEEWRIFCWGEVVPHIYILLFLASSRKVRGMGARWCDAEGKVIVEMSADRRVKGRGS